MLFPVIVITYIMYEKENEIYQKQFSQYLLQTVSQTHPLLMSWYSNEWTIYKTRDGFETPVRNSVTAARQLMDCNTSELRGYLFIQLNDRFIEENLDSVQNGSIGTLIVSDAVGDEIYRQQSALLDEPGIADLVNSSALEGKGGEKFSGKWLIA